MAPADDSNPALVDLADGRTPQAVADTTWLEIDLGGRFPIHSIVVVWNGADPAPAADVAILMLQDGASWSEPGLASRQSEAGSSTAFIEADERAWTRSVRIAVPNPERVAVVQVRAEEAAIDLIALRAMLDLDVTLLNEKPGANRYLAYSLESGPDRASRTLVGLSLFENGAFGNCLVQYIIALSVAKALNLKYVKVPKVDRSKVIFLTERLTRDGITFIPPDEALPADGYFLSGLYFDPTQFQRLVGLETPPDSRAIIQEIIRPLFNGLPTTFPPKPDDQLLIHIRSGDIFGTWVAPQYPQPPLAFYRMVIDRLLAEGRIASIKLVFENRLNPVIPALEAWITARGVPFTTQSGALTDDVAALMNGRYLVFGLGTFGPGVCQLSDRIEQVFYFASGWPQHFRSIPTIGRVVEVLDVAGAYTKVGEWDNSPERRALMLDYPIENLAFDDA